jgi:YgiT-type zinc finger domain-containing protein
MKKITHNGPSFWSGETCEYCGGSINERLVDLPKKLARKYILIKNVPAGVCQSCGTRYFSANVLKTIEETAKGRRVAKQKVVMEVFDY